jgi:hypothetical protein
MYPPGTKGGIRFKGQHQEMNRGDDRGHSFETILEYSIILGGQEASAKGKC